MRETTDAFGKALWDWVDGGTVAEIVERDDGQIEIGAGGEVYLMEYHEWPTAERTAMRYARGRVLDVGCGGGRVAKYLQETGARVVGVDSSPLAVKAARRHGVQDVRRLSIDDLADVVTTFDTLVLFGNNLGVFGTPRRATRFLRSWATRMTPGARILMESTSPLSGGAPVIDRAYCVRNRERGRALGQCRLRVWYDRAPGEWFSWFFASPTDLRALVRGTGWVVREVLSGARDEPYVAVLERV